MGSERGKVPAGRRGGVGCLPGDSCQRCLFVSFVVGGGPGRREEGTRRTQMGISLGISTNNKAIREFRKGRIAAIALIDRAQR